jgi:hypothetical protein
MLGVMSQVANCGLGRLGPGGRRTILPNLSRERRWPGPTVTVTDWLTVSEYFERVIMRFSMVPLS